MFVTEIIIAVLLGLLVVVSSIYLTYFLIRSHKEVINRLNEGDYEEEPNVKGKAFSIILVAFFAVSLFTFTTNIVYRATPYVNGQHYVSVNTDSMSQAIDSNTYLEDNKLTNQIAQYDIAVFDPIKGENVHQYDIILFKKDGKLIVHRVIEITASNTFKTQGDKNINPDNWEVTYSELIGKYNHSLKFMSFVNYLGYTPGFYVFLVGVTYDIGVILYFEIKKDKLIKANKKSGE